MELATKSRPSLLSRNRTLLDMTIGHVESIFQDKLMNLALSISK